MPHVLPFSSCSNASIRAVGGKVASLGEMLRAGIPVPPGVVVTTDGLQYFLAETGLGSRIRERVERCNPADYHELEAACAEIREWFHTAEIPPDLKEEIVAGYRELAEACGDPELAVAVRSSATAEDSTDFSFAGLHETFLWVRGDEELLAATLACWSSLYTPRAMAYRLRMGIGYDEMLLAVGIQKMVLSATAGVMFTLDPSNGDPSVIAIEGSWGLGEAVVKGEVTPDRFRINKITRDVIEHVVSPKTVEYVPDSEGRGVLSREVPAERQLQPCLTREQAMALASMGKRIERYYGCPQDIEWAIDQRQPFPEGLHIVQARSETAWSHRARKLVEERPQALGYVVDFLMKHG